MQVMAMTLSKMYFVTRWVSKGVQILTFSWEEVVTGSLQYLETLESQVCRT